MNEQETPIWKAIRHADEKFEKAGATGTKTWMRDFFLPSLEESGLEIAPKGTLLQISALQEECQDLRNVKETILKKMYADREESNRLLREVAETWGNDWDCSANPGHRDMAEVVGKIRSVLAPEVKR